MTVFENYFFKRAGVIMSNDKIISIKKDSIIMDSIIMDLLIMESNSYGNVQIVRMIPIIVLVFTLCLDGFD